MKTMFSAILLAGVVPAVALAGETSESAGADWFGPTQNAGAPEPAGAMDEAAAAASLLADRMALVYDRATADAAAAEVAPLVGKLAAQGGEETFWTRMHMAYTGCYGSPELRKALQPLLPPADIASTLESAQAVEVLMDVWQTLQDVAGVIHSVQDKATADKAAEAITLFSRHLDDCLEKGNSIPAPQGNRIDLVIFFYSGEYRRSGALYKEWGELQNRSGNYYGSELLAEAMENLCAAMENLDQSADLYAIGKMLLICPVMENEMRHGLALMAGIHDCATADAAAPQLQACVDRMQAATAPLGSGYEKDLGHVSPMFLFLTLSCDRRFQLLKREGYYGSAALRAFFEHK